MNDSVQRRVFRFAPSPNGRLHLGHAYSALLNQHMAIACDGRLLLRIEDIDRARCTPGYEHAIRDDLAWLGLTFEEPARRQSEHFGDYQAAFDRLADGGLVYPCFCTRGDIARACREIGGDARDPDDALLYPGACRRLGVAERDARLATGAAAAWRIDISKALRAAPAKIDWLECGEGAVEHREIARPEAWGDAILRRKDIPASYHIAVVVDDALQGVTDVVRGRDLFASTSLHRLLQVLLDLPAPRYHHHRLAVDPGGAKLAKSVSSRPLSALRDHGVTAAQIRAALGFEPGDAGDLHVAFS